MLCCSRQCEKKSECSRYIDNNHDEEIYQVEDLYSWCGELGSWGMFIQIPPDPPEPPPLRVISENFSLKDVRRECYE